MSDLKCTVEHRDIIRSLMAQREASSAHFRYILLNTTSCSTSCVVLFGERRNMYEKIR